LCLWINFFFSRTAVGLNSFQKGTLLKNVFPFKLSLFFELSLKGLCARLFAGQISHFQPSSKKKVHRNKKLLRGEQMRSRSRSKAHFAAGKTFCLCPRWLPNIHFAMDRKNVGLKDPVMQSKLSVSCQHLYGNEALDGCLFTAAARSLARPIYLIISQILI
jgi:hypothetical protein